LSTDISASEILHMLLKRSFYRLITYIHVAEVFGSGAECGRARNVIRRCPATAVVRSTVRNSALTWDLQSRGRHRSLCSNAAMSRGELSYLAPLGSENISAPYFKQCFFRGGWGDYPQTESNTTPPSPKTEITNILFYVLNFASIIKFKM